MAEKTRPVDFLPFVNDHYVMALEKVAVVVQDGAAAFGLGAMCEVWGEEYHADDDCPTFDFKVCAAKPGRITGQYGFDLLVEHGLEAVEAADLVCVAPR